MTQSIIFFISLIVVIIAIPVILAYSIIGIHLIHDAFGQTIGNTTIRADNIPTNLKLQDQQAFLEVLPPNGIQSGNAYQVGTAGTEQGTIGMVLGIVSSGIAAFSTYQNSKTKKDVKAVAGTQVRIVETVEGVNNQTFELMPNKGNEITNKPETKQSTVTEIKKEAIKNASNA